MTIDPFGGRIPSASAQPPYANALTVTPADGDDLPVIPSAFYLPQVVAGVDDWRTWDGTAFDDAAQDPGSVQQLRVEMQNGAEITLHTAGMSKDGSTIILPMRIRKILWDQSSAIAVTLLW